MSSGRNEKDGPPACQKKTAGGDAESFAEFFDVMFVEFAFAAEDLGDDAFGAEQRGEVFLAEIVGVCSVPHLRRSRFKRAFSQPSRAGLNCVARTALGAVRVCPYNEKSAVEDVGFFKRGSEGSANPYSTSRVT